jgi:predicted Ser/Thr protein kinase
VYSGLSFKMAPGTLLAGRYRLENELGRGGMAVVFRAMDEKLGIAVAVKLLVPGLEHSHMAVERLRREASAYAQLAHPNIVQLHELVVEDDFAFIAMELIEGPSLKQHILMRGPLSVEETASIGAQIAAALDAAHRHGVIHRDIKPQNVLLAPGGQVKVVDFGLARLHSLSGLTATRTTIGTPEYMAPEQIQAQPVDPRADLYSLGIVLYECLAGRPPYGGNDIFAVFQQHLTGVVRPLAELRKDVPAWLETLVLTCMRRRKEDRVHSASAVIEALAGDNAATLSVTSAPGLINSLQESCPRCGGPAPELVGFCLLCGCAPEAAPRTVDALVVEDRQRWERENRTFRDGLAARLPGPIARRLQKRMEARQKVELELLDKHAREVERLREELEVPVSQLALDERALLVLSGRRAVQRWRKRKQGLRRFSGSVDRWIEGASQHGLPVALRRMPPWSLALSGYTSIAALGTILAGEPVATFFLMMSTVAVFNWGIHAAERKGEKAQPQPGPGGLLGKARQERLRSLVQGRRSRRILEPLARLLAALAESVRITRRHPQSIGAVTGDLTQPVCDLVDLALALGEKAAALEDYLAREAQEELEADIQRLEHRLKHADPQTALDLERLKSKKEGLLLKRLDLDRQLERQLVRLSLTAAEAEDLTAALHRLSLAQSSDDGPQPSVILGDLRNQLAAMEELLPGGMAL